MFQCKPPGAKPRAARYVRVGHKKNKNNDHLLTCHSYYLTFLVTFQSWFYRPMQQSNEMTRLLISFMLFFLLLDENIYQLSAAIQIYYNLSSKICYVT